MIITLNMTCIICSTYYNGLLNIADIPFKLLATKAHEERVHRARVGVGEAFF